MWQNNAKCKYAVNNNEQCICTYNNFKDDNIGSVLCCQVNCPVVHPDLAVKIQKEDEE